MIAKRISTAQSLDVVLDIHCLEGVFVEDLLELVQFTVFLCSDFLITFIEITVTQSNKFVVVIFFHVLDRSISFCEDNHKYLYLRHRRRNIRPPPPTDQVLRELDLKARSALDCCLCIYELCCFCIFIIVRISEIV